MAELVDALDSKSSSARSVGSSPTRSTRNPNHQMVFFLIPLRRRGRTNAVGGEGSPFACTTKPWRSSVIFGLDPNTQVIMLFYLYTPGFHGGAVVTPLRRRGRTNAVGGEGSVPTYFVIFGLDPNTQVIMLFCSHPPGFHGQAVE